MTALSDIREAIRVKREAQSSQRRMKVRVGQSAELSVIAAAHDHQLPMFIDHCAVERTDQFAGWEVVEI